MPCYLYTLSAPFSCGQQAYPFPIPLHLTGSRATPCYLYTLSAWGSVTVWTVHCMSAAEAASLDSELGMRQGSRVRLLRVTANVRMDHAALRPMRAPDESSIMAGVSAAQAGQGLAREPVK